MLVINRIDKALLHRTARRIEIEATKLEQVYGVNWASDKDSRTAKLEHDRLLRDARDLRRLAHRLGDFKIPDPEPLGSFASG